MRHDLKSDAHQKVGRAQAMSGEAVIRSVSDEALRPRGEADSTGQGLVYRALARRNLQRAWKRVKANKGAAGVDGLSIEQTAERL